MITLFHRDGMEITYGNTDVKYQLISTENNIARMKSTPHFQKGKLLVYK